MHKLDEKLICLGVESTAHTFGVSLVSSNGYVLADVNSKYNPPLGKGIHPREAAQHHCEVAPIVIEQAFKQSKVKLEILELLHFLLVRD